MGVRLIVEVLDHWQDAGLTAGERWDLLVLAENANDGTRLTFGPVHAQHILDRANKSPKGWKNAITALMRKKVITTHVPGRIKQVAVYHLEHLCPEPPHDGYKGQCTRAPKEGHPVDDPVTKEGHLSDDPMGHPADDPLGQEGHPADAERVIQEVTPTPPFSSFKESPLSTSSSSVAEDSTDASVSVTDAGEGGGGGDLDSSEDQEENRTRAAALVAQLDYRGKAPDKQQQKQLRALAAAALTAGWSENGLRRYLDISDDRDVKNPAGLYAYRLNSEQLPDAGEAEAISTALPPPCATCKWKPGADTDPSVRMHPFGGPCPDCHPDAVGSILPGDRNTYGWYQVARQLEAEEAKSDSRVRQAIEAGQRVQRQQGARVGRGYSNDVWQQPADPAKAAKIPHCGSPNCDPATRLKTKPDWTGEPHTSMCGDCHPDMKF